MVTQAQAWEITAAALAPDLLDRVPGFFCRVFGYTYSDERVYDPVQLREDILAGKRELLIATGDDGAIRGLMDLTFTLPSRRIGEIGELLIDPEAGEAGGGRMLKMLIELFKKRMRALCEERDLRTMYSLEVTEHQLTQRLAKEVGFVTGGVYLGHVPGWQRQLKSPPTQRALRLQSGVAAGRKGGRRSMVVAVRPIRTRTPLQTICLPERYDSLIREIYADYRLACEFTGGRAPHGDTTVTCRVDFQRSIALVEATSIGADAADVLIGKLEHYRSGFVEVVRIILPLSETAIGDVVERLVEAGCGYAAVLPQYRELPVLILQSLDASKLAPIEQGVLSPRAARIVGDLLGRPVSVDAPDATSPEGQLWTWVNAK